MEHKTDQYDYNVLGLKIHVMKTHRGGNRLCLGWESGRAYDEGTKLVHYTHHLKYFFRTLIIHCSITMWKGVPLNEHIDKIKEQNENSATATK